MADVRPNDETGVQRSARQRLRNVQRAREVSLRRRILEDLDAGKQSPAADVAVGPCRLIRSELRDEVSRSDEVKDATKAAAARDYACRTRL